MTTMDANDLSNSFKHFSLNKASLSGTSFNRTDGEIIVLCHNKEFRSRIKEVDIYSQSPQILTEMYSPMGTKGWYFLSPITRMSPYGRRIRRLAGDGFWSATLCPHPVRHNRETVGTKQSFRFSRGRPNRKELTEWMMDEYHLNGSDGVDFDKPVLYRIYKKGSGDREREGVRRRLSAVVKVICEERMNNLDGMMNKLNIGDAE